MNANGICERSRGTDNRIADLAYRLWQENGCVEGRALDYWLEAERRLHEEERQGLA